MSRALWTGLLAIALLWPARTLSLFDGMPLDGRGEALVIGLLVPLLWWLDRSFLDRQFTRTLIVALIVVKGAGLWLAPEGLCARFQTSAPFHGVIQTIPIDEPRGVLRSWDVRADWRSEAPACTAIVARAYHSSAEFPAWFTNLLDFIRPGRADLTLDLSGDVTVTEAGTLSIDTGEGMTVRGRIGGVDVASDRGRMLDAPLAPGTHPIVLHAALAGDRWRFVPRWNGADVWNAMSAARLTVTPPGRGERWMTASVRAVTTAIVIVLIAGWVASAIMQTAASGAAIAWMAVASCALAAMASSPAAGRFAPIALLFGALIPIGSRLRNLRGACLMIGVPWLAFFAARSVAQVGHVTAYSADDWLTYQVAGYRIFMHGYWLEGGSAAFDYQPLYRWISGALHLVFGDSSVGETYLDAACLLAGALLAFEVTKQVAGFRAGLVAGAVTLATFAAGTTWYFVGRGLSEISAAGCASMAAFFLLRARLGRRSSAAAAGAFAAAMFYTRLNHLGFALALPALLFRARTPSSIAAMSRAVRAWPMRAAGTYAAVFAAAVTLFAARTWWYTGVFSVLYGTSLRNNDTGLRPATLLSPAVWGKVGHSLAALVWMNEPPRVDLRAASVACGVALAVLALLQVPRVKLLPASLAIVCAAACISAAFVHTHNYPGRMSIHLVPWATALAVCGVAALFQGARSTAAPA